MIIGKSFDVSFVYIRLHLLMVMLFKVRQLMNLLYYDKRL